MKSRPSSGSTRKQKSATKAHAALARSRQSKTKGQTRSEKSRKAARLSPTNNTATPPNPKAKKSKARSSKKVRERLLKDLLAFLKGLPAFTFVLRAGGNSSFGPNLISAIDMMSNSSLSTPYSGPLPESDFATDRVEAARRYEEIIESVKARVEQLDNAGEVSYVLYWQAFGEAFSHLDHSYDIISDFAWEAAIEFMLERVDERIRCGG